MVEKHGEFRKHVEVTHAGPDSRIPGPSYHTTMSTSLRLQTTQEQSLNTSGPDSENEAFIDENGSLAPDPPSRPPYPPDKSQHTEESTVVERESYSAAKRGPQSWT